MRSLAVLASLALMLAAARPVVEGLPIDPAWGLDPVWDDGLAEVARYEAHRRVYGKDRSFETILITVKEDLDRRRAVKAEPPYAGRDLVAVLKLNIVSRIQTENYPYNYMTSTFVRRDDPRALVKLASSSQEWCGTTFKEVVTWDGPPRLLFHSYFDGQADGHHPLELGGGELLEEQLFVVLRGARMERGIRYRFSVYDSLITNGAGPPFLKPVDALWEREELVAAPAGEFRTRRIVIRSAGDGPGEGAALMTFWVDEGRSHALVKFEAADGRSLALTRVSREDYWSR